MERFNDEATAFAGGLVLVSELQRLPSREGRRTRSAQSRLASFWQTCIMNSIQASVYRLRGVGIGICWLAMDWLFGGLHWRSHLTLFLLFLDWRRIIMTARWNDYDLEARPILHVRTTTYLIISFVDQEGLGAGCVVR